MNKKNTIIYLILTIIDCIIIYSISSNKWVNRMPPMTFSFTDDFRDLVLGSGYLTLFLAIIFTIISFIINTFIIKKKIKIGYYFLFSNIYCKYDYI